ncbi:uncharacterized protein LOC126821729 [Patella vulgata]|uniref:uncharacterized protein LOC126821729 n=1 Tax=Patella vulgata TaxID=6465 RepID=UPI00217F3DFD|nr:uncharacterized protein LOC126821729 [Patella vulgata]
MNQITRRVLSHHLFKKLKFVRQLKHSCCNVTSTGQWDIIKDQRHFSTASSSDKKILSVSTLLLQDGLDIDELPIIIRHSDRSTFPFTDTGNTQSEKTMKHESQEDKQFKSHIQECASVKQIFQLLEIPSDFVNVLSATNALFKICQLQNDNKGLDDLHSFIHKAIMNELCDTVSNEICTLTKDTLIAVFQCSKRSEGILDRCFSSVVQEIEQRIGDGRFSIDELCLLAEILHTPHKDKRQRQLHKYLWIHIGNRYKDISETNVAKVLRLYPRSIKHEHYIKLIGNQIAVFWWKLKGEDFASVVTSLIQLNYHDNRLFSRLARWFSVNVHAVREIDLMVMLTAYNRLKHPVLHFFDTLEKYVAAKIDKIDVNLLALIVQLCRTKKYLSPVILDAAASHFKQHGQEYTPLQLLTILRCFGHLNYLPNEPTEFLFKVESVLDEAFEDLGVERICAILSSFAMIGKVSMNLAPRVFDELFLIRIKGTNMHTY